MDVTPLIREGQQIIQSYAAGTFRVSGVSYEDALLVYPSQTIMWQTAPKTIADMQVSNFTGLLKQASEIDVLLFGTGEKMQFINPKLRQELSAQGLPMDVMDTGAACRTYNVLMAEGRRVVAILMPT
jgi:uncharacterized protein